MNLKSSRICGAVAVLGIALALPALTNAAPIIDQSTIGEPQSAGGLSINDPEANGQSVAQSFTVGMNGLLTQIDLFVSVSSIFAQGDLVLELQGVSGGLPDGVVLAATTLAEASIVAGVNSFDVAAAGVFVEVGDILAFVVYGGPSAIGYSARRTGDDVYAGGQAMVRKGSTGDWSAVTQLPDNNTIDFIFQTWVDPDPPSTSVPEPSSPVLFGLALMALGVLRRKGAFKFSRTPRGGVAAEK